MRKSYDLKKDFTEISEILKCRSKSQEEIRLQLLQVTTQLEHELFDEEDIKFRESIEIITDELKSMVEMLMFISMTLDKLVEELTIPSSEVYRMMMRIDKIEA